LPGEVLAAARPGTIFSVLFLTTTLFNELKISFMKDQKNKQQQPDQGGKHNANQHGDQTPANSHGKSSNQHKSDMQGSDDDEKRTEIDDNPGETKKKIPNMQNKH
jgi:hypothetical protein